MHLHFHLLGGVKLGRNDPDIEKTIGPVFHTGPVLYEGKPMRKLATAALAFSAAVFLANYILPSGWLIVPRFLSAVLSAARGLRAENGCARQ